MIRKLLLGVVGMGLVAMGGQLRVEATMALRLTSSAFSHGGEIPVRCTCVGTDMSPALAWSGVPEGTKSLVLIVDDPDAPDPKAPKMTYVHWVVYNIPPTTDAIVEGIRSSNLPKGAQEGINDWKRAGYG